MSEKFGVHLRDKVDKELFGDIQRDVSTEGMPALHHRVDKYFDLWNIAPVYVRSGEKDFLELRKRLNADAGIIISNHPGYVDVPAILRCIDRNDIKIMVDRDGYETLRALIGETYIVPADANVLSEVASHIANGGVFLIFPTGGESAGSKIDFKPGFTKLLETLKPNDMVYSFHMDSGDVASIESAYAGRSLGVASAVYLNPALNSNRLRETKSFAVNENYSTAREWQQACSKETVLRKKTALLTEHFKRLYLTN
ncbi:MAG: 1-acyl-sn-glycerol-3-phosphate acyltransferase [Candidatus Paceibacterota bacterium]